MSKGLRSIHDCEAVIHGVTEVVLERALTPILTYISSHTILDVLKGHPFLCLHVYDLAKILLTAFVTVSGSSPLVVAWTLSKFKLHSNIFPQSEMHIMHPFFHLNCLWHLGHLWHAPVGMVPPKGEKNSPASQ